MTEKIRCKVCGGTHFRVVYLLELDAHPVPRHDDYGLVWTEYPENTRRVYRCDKCNTDLVEETA